MPRASAFNSTHFSSRPPHGEQFYDEMVKALGSGANYSDDFDGPAMARVYANARALGRCKYALERAANQFRTDRALELLPALEREYGIVPLPGSSIAERRTELMVAAWLARGARRSNVETTLAQLFGDDFVRYLTVDVADVVQSPTDPTSGGVYVKPGTPRSVFRMIDYVATVGTGLIVTAAYVAGLKAAPFPDTRSIIDTGNPGRTEAVTILSATLNGEILTFHAQFSRPHEAGVLLATGRHPQIATNKRHNLFVMSSDAVRDNAVRRRVGRVARRLLRGVSTWAITDGSGPFRVGVGRLGITTIGQVYP